MKSPGEMLFEAVHSGLSEADYGVVVSMYPAVGGAFWKFERIETMAEPRRSEIARLAAASLKESEFLADQRRLDEQRRSADAMACRHRRCACLASA